jgi:hypothetical protein
MERTLTKASKTDNLVRHMMGMGADLPRFIAKLTTTGRFIAVGALYSHGKVPDAVAIQLLFRPESVEFITPAEQYAAAVDAIYGICEIVSANPLPPFDVARVLALAGLDWPRGSGDYHGGKPTGQMTKEERRAADEELDKILGRLDGLLDSLRGLGIPGLPANLRIS